MSLPRVQIPTTAQEKIDTTAATLTASERSCSPHVTTRAATQSFHKSTTSLTTHADTSATIVTARTSTAVVTKRANEWLD